MLDVWLYMLYAYIYNVYANACCVYMCTGDKVRGIISQFVIQK